MEEAFYNCRCWLPPKVVGKSDLGGRLSLLGSDGLCVFTHSTHGVECAREVRAAWRARDGAGQWDLGPFSNAGIRTPLFSADVLKKCAPIASHLIAEEGRDGENEYHAHGLGDEWNMGCPKNSMCESEGEYWSEGASVSSSGSREGNVGNDALHVIWLYGPGGKISLFLQDWELAEVALSCHMSLDML